VEKRFYINDEFFGTNDVCIERLEDNTLEVIDYKHGVGVSVEVKDNPQLKYYAIGAMKIFKGDYDKIRLTIVQPRSFHPDGPIRSWDTTPQKLREFERELLAAGEETKKKDAPLVAGNHCQFCPAIAVCPAYKNMVLMAANAPGLASNLELTEILSRWNSAVKKVAYKAMSNGIKLPGWKLVEGRTNRKIIDKEKLVEGLKALGKSEEQIFKSLDPQLNNLGTLEKLAGKKWIADHLYKPVGKATIARESDKRPEISKASSDFADIQIDVESKEV
jgi:hypothetical protein